MVRVADARTRRKVELARSGVQVVRLEPGSATPLGLLRALLTADVLTRVLGLDDVVPHLVVVAPPGVRERIEAVLPYADRLGLARPAEFLAQASSPTGLGRLGLAAPPVVVTAPPPDTAPPPGTAPPPDRESSEEPGTSDTEAESTADTAGARLDVAPVEGPEPAALLTAYDPLGLRLALLSQAYDRPIRLTEPDVAEAARLLATWREQTARRAEQPSQALPVERVRPIRATLADDLDTPTALAALDALGRDVDLAPGAKFEAYAHLDRILALDLARDVGQL